MASRISPSVMDSADDLAVCGVLFDHFVAFFNGQSFCGADALSGADPVLFLGQAHLFLHHGTDIFADGGRGAQAGRLDAGAVDEVRCAVNFLDYELVM